MGQWELRLLAQARAHLALPGAGNDGVLLARLEDDAAGRALDMVRDLARVETALAGLAIAHADTIMAGRTLLQPCRSRSD